MRVSHVTVNVLLAGARGLFAETAFSQGTCRQFRSNLAPGGCSIGKGGVWEPILRRGVMFLMLIIDILSAHDLAVVIKRRAGVTGNT